MCPESLHILEFDNRAESKAVRWPYNVGPVFLPLYSPALNPIRPRMPLGGGSPAQRSDSEVLCLGLAAQWRSGVPWQSARGLLRYGRQHLRPLLPTLLTQRAFHRRLRRLWGAFILIQDAVAEALPHADDADVMDGFPMPVAHGARSFTPGWVADIARIGQGGNDRSCYGVRMRMVINQDGRATGWVLTSGNIQERWVAELLFSIRAWVPGGQGPLDAHTQPPTVTQPTAWMAVLPRCGAVSHQPILSESGFWGEDGLTHWAAAYAVHVYPLPKAASGAQRRWWRSACMVRLRSWWQSRP